MPRCHSRGDEGMQRLSPLTHQRGAMTIRCCRQVEGIIRCIFPLEATTISFDSVMGSSFLTQKGADKFPQFDDDVPL